jgi:hypothetical protein
MSATAREQFRALVADVAARAKAILPTQINGRVEAAVKLVLAGDVEPLEDGSIRVGSSDPTRYYRLQGQTCTCTDFTQGKAPDGWCTHRVAAGIQKRVQELLPTAPPVGPLPEAPASVNVHLTVSGRQIQLTLRDSDEHRLLARLDAVLQRFPVEATLADATPQCPRHGVPLKLNTKGGRSWWSHRTADGQWCKGK